MWYSANIIKKTQSNIQANPTRISSQYFVSNKVISIIKNTIQTLPSSRIFLICDCSIPKANNTTIISPII